MIGNWKGMRKGIVSPQANQFPCILKNILSHILHLFYKPYIVLSNRTKLRVFTFIDWLWKCTRDLVPFESIVMGKPFSEHINQISFVNVFLKLKFKIFYFFKNHVYIFSFCGSQLNMMWYRGHLRYEFCSTIKKSEILSVKGLRDQFWKWRRRLPYDLKDIYVLPFLLKVFPKKNWYFEKLVTWSD